MWLKSAQLKNIKSFADSVVIEFSSGCNLLVGPNNAGKSIIMRALSLLQPLPKQSNAPVAQWIRHGAENCEITLELEDPNRPQLRLPDNWDVRNWRPQLRFTKGKSSTLQQEVRAPNGNFQAFAPPVCNQQQPNNFVYPYFSRRKPDSLDERINLANARTIEEALRHLPSKVDHLSTSTHGATFHEICEATLGFRVSCVQSSGGKRLGLVLADDSVIPVTAMGEGTMNILVFLVHLSSASGKLFLIEEIENDLHPTALKRLLDFIESKSQSNQFVISTHSNIVVRYLGTATNSKVFSVHMRIEDFTRIPTSVCQPVPQEPEHRIRLLESLGYEPLDSYLWNGYLILEESTAERLIRDFFIPYLVPNLRGKLKTIAAQGVDDVEARLSDLMRLFVFIHTTPQYREKAWVAVDGGKKGEDRVSRLKGKFNSWPANHFRCFKQEHFER